MESQDSVAVVGLGAILPDAPDVATFWKNVTSGRYSISDVDPDRWDPDLYYDPDPRAPDKTYSKIGGWSREWEWDPIGWRIAIPPRVVEQMDVAQRWAVACTRAALADYGWPGRPLDVERTAVILGNALAGEKHYRTAMRVFFPEFARELERSESFHALPAGVRAAITAEAHERLRRDYQEITEDTMPGELSNVIAGRVANVFNLRGPNFVCDAACASAMAATAAAVEGLARGRFDAVITGGVDTNMNAPAFVKFCKIGALSATGSRPYGDGADGFVMGEGAALFLLKRLADAERDGDRVYAVLRGIGGSSDGRGKGITAPNPVGQRLAIERAWGIAGISPATATMVEGHGTSTRVGDVVEVQSHADVFAAAGAAPGMIALGSVKSNIGHLKGAAGAAGMLKAILALRERVLPPTLNARIPNPDIDFAGTPFSVVHDLREWPVPPGGVRRAGVSAFGFGGTNFHAVLEEHVPGRSRVHNGHRRASAPLPADEAVGPTVAPPDAATTPGAAPPDAAATPPGGRTPRPVIPEQWPGVPVGPGGGAKTPLRGALVAGASSPAALDERLAAIERAVLDGGAPARSAPRRVDLDATERIALDYADAADLISKLGAARRALAAETSGDDGAMWKALRGRGVHRGHGAAARVAFLYTGQGSQYANMLADLRVVEPIVAGTLADADRVMTPLLGHPLSEDVFADPADEAAVARAAASLMETEITQPAVMAADLALTRLLAAYGVAPDIVMGHSLGEYGALMAAGSLTFEHTLEAVSARGHEMSHLSVPDRGLMAAVLAPLAEVVSVVDGIDGCVVANYNSTGQAVIGGASAAVRTAMDRLTAAGHTVVPLPVSHAFHTEIVAPASTPLRATLIRLGLRPPSLPVVSNVTGDLYPAGDGALERILDLLAQQVASPVQFVAGLRTLHREGARVFVEVGPKKALAGFAEDVLGADPDVVTLFTNHPKLGDVVSFNQALCGLYAAGRGSAVDDAPGTPAISAAAPAEHEDTMASTHDLPDDVDAGVRRAITDLVAAVRRAGSGVGTPTAEIAVVTGASVGLPGRRFVFSDDNVASILGGDQYIASVPAHIRREQLDKRITRLVKRETEDPTFEPIEDPAAVVRLAARAGAFDIAAEYGVAPERVGALDRTTQLAIAAGVDALRDAGIPLVLHHRVTSKGSRLPDGYRLPDALRDDTGIVFASAFPGYESLVGTVERYERDQARRRLRDELRATRERLEAAGAGPAALAELDRRVRDAEQAVEAESFEFDRRFLFQILSMGHSQLAELVGARGPNTQVNAACASTTQAIAVAEDWIRAGRCRRVIVVAADDITSDTMLDWMAAGFLASGAAATDEDVTAAALPFDRRRHGMLLGMGAAAIVVEAASAARERGIAPICEVLAAVTANSAFHGTRLDVTHISQVMESLVTRAERDHGLRREDLAGELVFVSHETYTPARGGSAAAEVEALRSVFGDAAGSILVANTKGFTGHPMGVGIEDVVAVKALETGIVPPVPNHRETDPELGALRLSTGGGYPVRYALRLAAGFGSQISMALLRWVPPPDGERRSPDRLGYAHRIADRIAWQSWLTHVGGRPDVQLEVVQRTLRVREEAAVPASPAPPAAAVAAARPEPVPALQPAPAATAPPTPAPALQPAPATTVQPPSPPAAPGAPAGAATTADGVRRAVLELVAERTGYPEDMLDPDLDLEADLGVDTVKQAEIFALLRESYAIPRDDSLRLRDLPTLGHVIGYLVDRTSRAGGSSVSEAPAASAPQAAAEPASADAPAAARPHDAEAVRRAVLELVAGRTGYPEDMLDADLDLEADLGVDTVKQAEIFAVLRETYGIPRDDTLRLRDLPTLGHVIRFLVERMPGRGTGGPDAPAGSTDGATAAEGDAWPSSAPSTAGDAAPSPAAPPSAAPRRERRIRSVPDMSSADRLPRRVPVPVPRPPLEMCAPTGVRLESGARVVLGADAGGVARALAERLAARGTVPLVVDPAIDAAALDTALRAHRAAGPIAGVYWLAGLDVEPELQALDLAAWREGLRRRVKQLHIAMRALGGLDPPGTFLVTATRLGGRHGYDAAGATAPMGGGVTGYAKAVSVERPDILVKAVDHAAGTDAAEVAARLVGETLADPGAVEVGYADGARWAVGLEERPAADGAPGAVLDEDTVVVVTGAAGGIVAAVVGDLAAASGAVFHLLDVTPAPDPADPDLRRMAGDRDGVKRDLVERMRAAGERVTPVAVERRLGLLERQAAALAALESVEGAGGEALYHQVDLTDEASVAAAVDQIRGRHGRIDVLVHAAGVDRSHRIADKEPAEFDLVFDVKCDGLFTLLHTARGMPLGAVVVFSSVAGRFGNAGQTDYSAANDLLCKVVSNLRRTEPGTRAIAVDWTAWSRIGMASRGSIPRVMEAAGIEMLAPEVGIPTLRRELTAGATRGEVVVAGRLGLLTAERHPAGGVDDRGVPHGPMSGRVKSMGLHGPLVVETDLDPRTHPFLDDHRIDGTAVLPGVMAVEAFAEAASLVLPAWHVIAVDGVDFLAPFKFYRDEPRTVTVEVRHRVTADGVAATCRLIGSRMLVGRPEPQVTVHATATVLLSPAAPPVLTGERVGTAPPDALSADAVYRVYFHGPAYRVVEAVWRSGGDIAGRMRAGLPSDVARGAAAPVHAPRLVELCVQTAGAAEIATTGTLGLPTHADRIEVSPAAARPDGACTALVRPREGGFDATVVDGSGAVLVRVRGYRTVALSGQLGEPLLEPFRTALR